MLKKCIFVLFIVLSLTISGCSKENPYAKYWKIFPTDEQYKECFGDDYYCAYNEDSKEEYDEESFEEVCISDNFVGMSYYCLNHDIYSLDISLEMSDKIDHLSKQFQSWLGDFDEDSELISNDRYSLYCLCHDLDPGETNLFVHGLYGKFYYDDFEIYYEIINYNCSLDSLKLRHLDELQEYLDQVYNLIDTNRIEAGL